MKPTRTTDDAVEYSLLIDDGRDHFADGTAGAPVRSPVRLFVEISEQEGAGVEITVCSVTSDKDAAQKLNDGGRAYYLFCSEDAAWLRDALTAALEEQKRRGWSK